jgi:hypothetical protein
LWIIANQFENLEEEGKKRIAEIILKKNKSEGLSSLQHFL